MIQTKINKFLIIVFSIIFIFAALSNGNQASGQQNSTITVTPGVISVELTEPGQVVDTEVSINNTFQSQINLAAKLKGVDDTTGTLVATGPLDETLEKSISLSQTEISVPPNDSSSIFVRVTNNDSLTPGGHYAALTLSQIASDGSQVGLQSTISVSIYIIKRGGEKIDLQIINQSINYSLFRLPTESTIEFKNTGNVHITPRASVTVRSSDGKTVYAKGVSNEGSKSLLPEKQLADTFSIIKVSSLPLLPTKLKIITEYRADGVSNARYTESYFWYVSPIFILGIIAIISVIILLLFRLVKISKKKLQPKTKQQSKNPKPKPKMISDIRLPENTPSKED
jgi:hypothetical protein